VRQPFTVEAAVTLPLRIFLPYVTAVTLAPLPGQ
jgi:hypothetical protein